MSTSDDTITLARRHDILTVRGDSSDRATLSAAGVAGAAELYGCTSRGLGNTDIALLAGQQGASKAAFPVISTACSVSNEELNLPDTVQYTVFICLDDENDALRASLAVGRLVASDRAHVVTCMRASAPFAQTLAGNPKFLEDLRGRISVFEVIQEACMPANIRDDAFIEQLARSIHADYVAKSEAHGEKEAENKSMVPWDKLPRDLRDANVAQAAGIGAKLEAINAVVVPESADASDFSFTPEEVEGLAEMEHKRWMNERTAQGWSYGPERDNRRKIHPDLHEWGALDEGTREKDRDAVRAIPGILREAGYQILRLPPDSAPRG